MRDLTGRKKWLLVVTGLVLMLSLVLGACAAPTPAPAPVVPAPAPAPVVPAPAPAKVEMPKLISIGSGTLGFTGSTVALAMGTALEKELGIPVRSVPVVDEAARMKSLAVGDFTFSHSYAGGGYYAMNAIGNFPMGPVPLRVIWAAEIGDIWMFVRADSDIYTAADLKGKKWPDIKASPAIVPIYQTYMGYAGYTFDDVEWVPVATIGTAADDMMAGKVDTCYMGSTSGKIVQTARIPPGIRVVAFEGPDLDSPLDPAKVERASAYSKLYKPDFLVPGWGVLEGKNGWSASKKSYFAALPTIPADVIYEIVKGIDKAYPNFKDVYAPATEDMSLERAADLANWQSYDTGVPFHEGLIRYLKEKGMWTAEHDAYQEKWLAVEAKKMEEWKATHK